MSAHPLDVFLEQMHWRRFTESDIIDTATRARLICFNPQYEEGTPSFTSIDVTIRYSNSDLAIGVQSRNLTPFLQTLIVRSSALRTVATTFGLQPCVCRSLSGASQWSPLCVPLLYHGSMNEAVNFVWIVEMFRYILAYDQTWQCSNPGHLIDS